MKFAATQKLQKMNDLEQSRGIYIQAPKELFMTYLMLCLVVVKKWDNHSKNIWDKLWFLCEIAPCGNSSVFVFQEFLASIKKNSFWQKDWAIVYNSSEIFLICPKFLSHKLFGNLWCNLHIPCLLLIVQFVSLAVKRKFGKALKKSHNIIYMIVWKFFFYFLCLYEQLQFLKTTISRLKFTSSF